MDRGTVAEAERRRCAAMLGNDAGALDGLLDPRLCFTHATGLIDDKAAYLAKMAAGRIDYLAIDWPEQQVIALGADAALITGIIVSDVRVDGVEKWLNNRVLMVWTRSEDAWRLVAFQSTPIKT